MIAALLLCLLACDEPVALPPPKLEAGRPTGLMVRVPGVEGFVARPRQAGAYPAVLVLVDDIDDTTRARALELAGGGEIALLVEPAIDTDGARAYLAGMAGVASVRELCLREACP